ncbi:MAG: hypothetical protein U0V49_00485 [Saprospiraceae bacterium]
MDRKTISNRASSSDEVIPPEARQATVNQTFVNLVNICGRLNVRASNSPTSPSRGIVINILVKSHI